MSIWTSLITASSGLDAHGKAIGVVGDNIANVSTVGFRGSRAAFASVLGGVGANGRRQGAGVVMGASDVDFGQGALQQTGRNLDLAVRGRGFFVLQGNHEGVVNNYYTRDGRVGTDSAGFLTHNTGLRLQGYALDPTTGTYATSPSDLQIPSQGAPRATTTAEMFVQLTSTAQATGQDNFASPITVYDSRGTAHVVDVHFQHQGNDVWNWSATVDGAEVVGGTAGVDSVIGNGSLTFNANGELATEAGGPITADFVGAAAGQTVDVDFGQSLAEGGTGRGGSTSYDEGYDVRSTTQDGYAAGTLQDLRMTEDGTVEAVYSNGQIQGVAHVALATFGAVSELKGAGSQLFLASSTSGSPSVGQAAAGSRGAISSGALERSNVNLGSELVSLIAYQRAFQANARTVTTADEMMAETANLKR